MLSDEQLTTTKHNMIDITQVTVEASNSNDTQTILDAADQKLSSIRTLTP